MTGVPPLSKSIGWTRGIADARNQMFDLQRQLATGKKATTYGGLGPERTLALSTRARLSVIEGYQSTIGTIDLRLKVMTQALQRFGEIGREVRSDLATAPFEVIAGNRTAVQLRAENALDEALSLLGSEAAGRYLFGGRATDADPVAPTAAVLDGVGDRAGFRQVLAERNAADLGGGLGRLQIEATGDTVTIGEDHLGPFGFKIAGLSTDINGASVTPPGGAPAEADIALGAAAPEPGDTVRLRLAMPDGSETTIELKAAAAGEGGPGKFEIGADAQATAANLHGALQSAIGTAASAELAAASSFAAADDFFNLDAENPPRRVDGPPFDSATGHREATPDDTLFWYTGDAATDDPRATAIGRIDDQMSVAYGARAIEGGLRETIQNLAVLAAEGFDAELASDAARYRETTKRAAVNLARSPSKPSADSMQAELAGKQHTLGKAKERHQAARELALDVLGRAEEADANEVAVQLLQLNTRLQASYEVTAMLSRMSLVFHI